MVSLFHLSRSYSPYISSWSILLHPFSPHAQTTLAYLSQSLLLRLLYTTTFSYHTVPYSILQTQHMLRRALISTAFILLSCLLPYPTFTTIDKESATVHLYEQPNVLDTLRHITACCHSAPFTLLPAFTLLSTSESLLPSLVNKVPKYTHSFTWSNLTPLIITSQSVTHSSFSITITFVVFGDIHIKVPKMTLKSLTNIITKSTGYRCLT